VYVGQTDRANKTKLKKHHWPLRLVQPDKLAVGWSSFLHLVQTVNDMPTPSHRIKLVFYVDDMAIVAISHTPLLPVSYLQSCLSDLEYAMGEWRIDMSIANSTKVLFAKVGRCIPKPVQYSSLGANPLG
jgi:hypothetical protein